MRGSERPLWKRTMSLVALLAAIVPGLALSGQDNPRAAEDRLNVAYLAQIGADFPSVLKSPASWTGRDWLTLGVVAGAGVVLASKR